MGFFVYIMSESLSQSLQSPQEEIWKTHSSGYEVSSLGRVKGKTNEFRKFSKKNGYLTLQLSFNSKVVGYQLHRLIWESFNGPIEKEFCINHKDGIKTNNSLQNLEKVSYLDNTSHAIKNNLIKVGENSKAALLKEQDVLDIYSQIKSGMSNKEIAKKYKVGHTAIYNIKMGYTWKHLYQNSGLSFERKRLLKPRANPKYKNKPNFSEIEHLTNEKWKRHKSGFYISTHGRIIGIKGKIINPQIRDGYKYIKLGSKGKSVALHRIVYLSFSGSKYIPKSKVINHINGIKLDNMVENLECVTRSENGLHAYRSGLNKRRGGAKNSNCKLKESEILEIYNLIKSSIKADDIARKYKIRKEYIYAIKNGVVWKELWAENFNN